MRQLIVSLTALLSFYRRRPLQAFFLLSGLVTGVALWSAVQFINGHARASYQEADQLLGAEAKYWLRSRTDDGISVSAYIDLRRQGFHQIYPVLELRRQTAQGGFVRVIATDLLALGFSGAGEGASNPFAANSWLPFIQPDYEAWYPEQLAREFGVQVGERLQLANGLSLPPARFQTRGQQGQRVLMDVGAAMDVFGESRFTYLAVGELSLTEQQRLMRLAPAELKLVKNNQSIDLSQLTRSLHTNLTALGLLSFAVGMFIVFNAVRFSLVNRRVTLVTLRELGVSSASLNVAVLIESMFWSLLGASIGVLLGGWLAKLMLPAVATSLASLYGANLSEQMASSFSLLPQAFLLTSIGVALALTLPLWRTAREALLVNRVDGFNVFELRRVVVYSGVLGLFLLLAAKLGVELIVSVETGFVVIALMMFGAALLLPGLTFFTIVWVSRFLPNNATLARWSVRDALMQLPHLRVALMALLLTLVANIGVTTLVGSFRTALSDWLQIRLSADVYLAGDVLLPESMPWERARHTRYGVEMRYKGTPTTIYGVDPAAPDISRLELIDGLPNGLSLWRSEAAEIPGIIANEQLQHLQGVNPGELIELGSTTFMVVGFLHDYGNTGFSFWLPNNVAVHDFPQMRPMGTALWVEPEHVNRVGEYLLQLGFSPGDWVEQIQVKQVSFQIFDRTFAITAALNSLTLAVAGIALFAALMAVHQSRIADYGHWRALGLEWLEWLFILAVPLLLMLALTLLLAIPLGYLLSWLLIHELNVMSFGWTMPLLWQWQPVVNLGGLSVLIAMVALALTLIRVKRDLALAVRQTAGAG